ncbi:ADP-ribosylglycohydrolase [Parapedobacter koreensis]|uniref:ADP-ribosylglycohydrolase n=2 Tax=Parapedobacter koreensis TaxID=332977 RepID=A0A1H7THC4_9SPHI|nr:ADP-ribosylglycohydrolase [Parapedobacter koreensis]
MKRMMIYLAVLFFVVQQYAVYAQTAQKPETLQLPVETVVDKIRGGLLGQILGNLNGLPHEFKYEKEPGQVKNYVPQLLEGAQTDDDTDFEWVYILEMQKKRNVFLPYDDIELLWKDRINRRIWCSNRYARHLMDLNIDPPYTGNVLLNPWADFNVSGQFLCETFGLLAPAMPQTAAKIGLNYTQVAIDGEPAQTTQLFTAMIAAAFLAPDINEVIGAGIAAIDPKSNTFKIIENVKKWHHQYPGDWQAARRQIRDTYTQEGGAIRDMNGTELNTAAILAALLYGAGDFAETLKLAFNMGWDADCNAATVGTIVGVLEGYRKLMSNEWRIVDRYQNTTRDNMPMDETITSFADRLVDLFEVVNENNGGSKSVSGQALVYNIVREEPKPLILIKPKEALKSELLQREPVEALVSKIREGSKEEQARAAYIIVCLDLYPEISKKYPSEWAAAKQSLSGYVKVMNNVFHGGDFKSLTALQQKFTAAGFTAPAHRLTDNEVYSEVVWVDPKGLY